MVIWSYCNFAKSCLNNRNNNKYSLISKWIGVWMLERVQFFLIKKNRIKKKIKLIIFILLLLLIIVSAYF